MITSPMKTYQVEVRATGHATVVAETKKAAREKAERGEYRFEPRARWRPLVSTIKEKGSAGRVL